MHNLYHMTQSLLSAWQYQYDAYDAEAGRRSFLAALNREPQEKTEAMQEGIDFENSIYAAIEKNCMPENETAKQIASIIKGGSIQFKAVKNKTIAGMDLELYGILDVLKAGVIYDIKRSNSYEVGKYLNSPQHPMYFEIIPEARRFEYLVSDGKTLFTEIYDRDQTCKIDKIICDFIDDLRFQNLLDLYKEKWRVRQDA